MPILLPAFAFRDEIRALLATDRAWAVYAIGDLAPGLFEECEWYAAPGERPGLALIYRAFEIPVLFTLGEPDVVQALLDELPDEERLYLSIRSEVLPLIQARYRVEHETAMWRMVLDRAAFTAPATNAMRLGPADHEALARLYADGEARGEAPGFFTVEMLEVGVFFGVREDRELVSAAGTHVVAPGEGVAAIGNVYTRRDRRGRGLARQVTGSVTAELLRMGIETIALNVAQSNAAALRVYESLGFRTYCAFYEGVAVRKPRE
jgi:ribosomal protein S18 acetylase RimI-like enzyme